MNFLKQIFTWWHKQTIGTFIYTVFTGKFAGKDQFGNKYYSNSKGKRWVIYKNNIEASKIPPHWHAWLHKTINIPPINYSHKYSWQKNIEPNLTGTSKAYFPNSQNPTKSKDGKKIDNEYEKWQP